MEPPKCDTAAEQNRYNSEIEKAKSTAWRHIFLIRHGQYNVNATSDKDQTLTDMGNAILFHRFLYPVLKPIIYILLESYLNSICIQF